MSIPYNFKYKNIITAQHLDIFDKFRKLFLKVKPSQILEIGTYNGGLTLILRDILDDLNINCKIVSYDIIKRDCDVIDNEILNGKNIELNIKNVFNDDYSELVYFDEIVNYINKDGVTLVLCDGGNKIKEFNLLSKYIKSGDIIMAHDYSPNDGYFYKFINNKIWNFWEICDLDVEKAIIDNNLLPFMSEEFTTVVWLCKIKAQSLNISENLNNNLKDIQNILNSIGEQIEGNLICDITANNSHISRNESKIINLQNLVKDKKKICEIGVNAGHSLLLMLDINPNAEYLLFDIKYHTYTQPCVDYIKNKYPNTKITIIYGDSVKTIPEYIKNNEDEINSYDLCHIDGGHGIVEVSNDYENVKLLSNSEVIFDDYNDYIIKNFIDDKLNINEIEKVYDNIINTNLHIVYKYKK